MDGHDEAKFQYYLNEAINSDSYSDAPKAVDYFSQALEISPSQSWTLDILQRRASAYCDMGDHRHAIGDSLAAIEMAPDQPSSYFAAGLCYDHLEEYDPAIEYFSRAIQINPVSDCYMYRGIARYRNGNTEEAIEDYDVALEICYWQLGTGEEFGDICQYRGIAHYTLGNIGSAREDFDKSISHLPDISELHADNVVGSYSRETLGRSIRLSRAGTRPCPSPCAAFPDTPRLSIYDKELARDGDEDNGGPSKSCHSGSDPRNPEGHDASVAKPVTVQS